MTEIKPRRHLREKEATQILQQFSQKMKTNNEKLFDTKNPTVEAAETPTATIYFINGKPLLAKLNEAIIPTLIFEKALLILPRITVNMGAVPHICNGADLMAPGVTKIQDTFNVNDYAVIIDERHQKSLAIVTALTDSRTAGDMKHGKIAENLHYVGDALWNQLKKS
jgi:PUA domain protein